MHSFHIAGLLLFAVTMLTRCADQPSEEPEAHDHIQPSHVDSALLIGPAPGTYQIRSKQDTVQIPFEFYGMNLLIHGEINGRHVKLLIDNGILWDQVWFFNGEVDSIGLRYKDEKVSTLTGIGEAGGSAIKEGYPVNISLGGVDFFDQPVLISVEEAGYDQYFPGINGQVSAMLFKHFIVTFDFERNVMILTKPGSQADAGCHPAMPMRKESANSFSIPVKIKFPGQDETTLPMDLDIGTVVPLYLIENRELNIRIPEHTEKKLFGYGASGAIYTYSGLIERLDIGGFTLYDVPYEMAENEANVNSAVVKFGTLGLPLMMKFKVTYDYGKRQICFEPNRHFKENFGQNPASHRD